MKIETICKDILEGNKSSIHYLLDRIQFNAFDDNHTLNDKGLCLSPRQAFDCVVCGLERTYKFCKGVYEAATDLLKIKDNIEILYIGTGPLGILLLPTLIAYKDLSHRFNITLVDIHKSSTDHLKKVLESLNIKANVITTDGTIYKPVNNIDLFIVECMDKALSSEQQIDIVKNIQPYLSKDSIMIPEQVDLILTTNEHLFSLNKNTEEFNYSKVIELKNTQKLYIKTIIKIYRDTILKDNDSILNQEYFLGEFTDKVLIQYNSPNYTLKQL